MPRHHIAGHDWRSADYVKYWIANDVSRDPERQPVLRRVAQLIPFETDSRLRILEQNSQDNWVSRYTDKGRPDHFAHAEAYCILALNWGEPGRMILRYAGDDDF